MSVWNQPRAKPPILVKASILASADDFDLVSAVYGFVVEMEMIGKYLPSELPSHAIQLSNAYVYDCEIKNGGHSQYIHNINVGVSPKEAREKCLSAYDGLVAMGAAEHSDVLRQMIAWTDANPNEVDEQTGFEGGRAEELEALDTEFYKLIRDDAIIQRAAAWIKGWSDVNTIEDAEFDSAYHALLVANQKRLHRISVERVNSFNKAITHPVLASTSLALAAAEEPEVFFELFTRHVIEREGQADMAYWFEASGGYRYVIADHAGVAAYECKINPGYRQAITSNHVGQVVGRVEADSIDAFLDEVSRRPVAAAADLLLRHARPACNKAILSPAGPFKKTPWLDRLLAPESANPLFHLVADNDLFRLTQTKQGFVLSLTGGVEKYGPVSMAEAERHAREIQE
jgi:hypothetical protein